MIKIIGIGFICCIVCTVVKKYAHEYFVLCEITSIVLLIFTVYPYLCDLLDFVLELTYSSGIESGLTDIVIKAMGIALITDFAVSVCNDNGDKAVASNLEFCGKVFMFTVSLPAIKSIIEIAVKFINAK